MNLGKLLVLGLSACVAPAPASLSTHSSAVTETCTVVAPSGGDDRAALQAAFNTGCAHLTGTISVLTPPMPRARQILTAPRGLHVYGDGAAATRLTFTGATNGYDWRGIQGACGMRMHDLRVDNPAVVATTPNDQVPLIRFDGDGCTDSVEIDHMTFANPTLGGDCMQFVGYDVTTPTDRRIWNVSVHDSLFENCSRSGIAIHSGLHHCSIKDNRFLDTWDQDIDGESGGSHGLDDCEVADNLFVRGPHAQSAISMAPQDWSNAHIHHNRFDGRSLDVYGCQTCEQDHNVILNTMPGPPSLYMRKNLVDVAIHHETYEHPGPTLAAIVKIEQAGSVHPINVTIRDSKFIQHAGTTSIAAIGVVGFYFEYNTVTYDGAVARMAMDVQPSAGTYGVQTTDVHVRDSTFTSALPWQAVLHLNGGGYGTGAFELTNVWATSATRGLWCENLNTAVGVQGPATYAGNTLPAPICGSVIPL
jgi:hypothetical protein